MRTSVPLYPSSILALFLLELLGPRFVAARVRYHTDDSIEVKYYDKSGKVVDKMAFSLTGDLECEHGGGASCYTNSAKGPKQDFLGFIRRAILHGKSRGSLQGMGHVQNIRLPAQPIHNFPLGYNYRAANVPYFSGPGGVPPPGGNQGALGSLPAGHRTCTKTKTASTWRSS